MKMFCALVTVCLGFQAAAAELVDGIEAVVHDPVISRQDVESKLKEAQRGNREQLVQRQSILHEFKTAGYSLPESVLDELVNERIKRASATAPPMIKTLQSKGLNKERFRHHTTINQEFIISPHKIEVYYLDHKDEFTEPE